MAEKPDKQGADTNKPYQPIDCAIHDQLELAIMRQQVLSMQWTDDSGNGCEARVKPLDTVVCKGVEYLNFLYAEEETVIRLDQIVAFEVCK